MALHRVLRRMVSPSNNALLLFRTQSTKTAAIGILFYEYCYDVVMCYARFLSCSVCQNDTEIESIPVFVSLIFMLIAEETTKEKKDNFGK